MSSTNKTTNYELSQYIGSDKPTYLGDYNGDMLKIDTQMKKNADDIETVESTANTASANATTALTNAGTAQTTANNAQTTATSAQTTATNALNKSNQNESDIAKLNLVNFESFEIADMTASIGTFNTGSKLNCASNSDGSIGKIYGWVLINNVAQSASQGTVTIQTALRPDELINIEGLAIRQYSQASGNSLILKSDVSIATDGTVTIKFPTNTSITSVSLFLPACLLFMKNFGDTTE